ncbi:MAG: ABC transporter ATP-binding protein [Nanoarchaeota archaeon]|nr:ABC transporter ATP-binding protein [Nanoarchaeota archaeon]MBU1322266.1 ABC transporter ATP-binding protein [Nanoarchaeota archaeon]MBU1598019.1 ABC transporter ATP-binding protein [Nanoarchaeota archaeon]MBU2441015.1 ABC transporter ATP-binding protein [Nanoarchaeota archaeon]
MKMIKRDSKPIIELRNVWKIYQMGVVKVNALCNMDLVVKKGEFVSIMGPSGSGKSTAMNMIGALDIPTKGTILLEGHDIAKMTESNLAQIRGRKIGFIFQQFNLIPTLSALENITLPMIFQGIPSGERKIRAKKLLELVDLGDRIHHKPTELSGGQQQRVAIARALSNNPEVILADEPTGNLDSKTGQSVIGFLKKLHEEEGKTIIMVTHDLNVAKHANRTEYLLDGRIVKSLNNNNHHEHKKVSIKR